MNIVCHECQARYRIDPALFKGAKGIRVRCRRCGNSLDIYNPGEIEPEMNVGNDTSFFRFISASWDPSDNRGIEPAVSHAGQDQSTPLEMERTLPVREPVDLSQGNGKEEDPWRAILNKPLPVSAGARAPIMFYPPFPKSPGNTNSRKTFRWFSMIALCIFLLLVVGGSVYLILTPAGKGVLAAIGRNVAEAVKFFRS